MRTTGWFLAVALSLVFTGVVRAEGDEAASKDSEGAPKLSSTDEMLNRDSCGSNDVACCCTLRCGLREKGRGREVPYRADSLTRELGLYG